MSFDKISNDKVQDESRNKNDGKIIKAKIAKGKGKYGDAMEFNGKDSFIDINNSKSLSIPDQVSDFSLGQLEKCW